MHKVAQDLTGTIKKQSDEQAVHYDQVGSAKGAHTHMMGREHMRVAIAASTRKRSAIIRLHREPPCRLVIPDAGPSRRCCFFIVLCFFLLLDGDCGCTDLRLCSRFSAKKGTKNKKKERREGRWWWWHLNSLVSVNARDRTLCSHRKFRTARLGKTRRGFHWRRETQTRGGARLVCL